MGKYINADANGAALPACGKADALLQGDFEECTLEHAKTLAGSSAEYGVVVVVENGFFDAAAWAFSLDEFEAFNFATDLRPVRFLFGPLEIVEKIAL